ncbi:MAG: YXWGXW repeat-containing protein, partial [Steroidobacteraceae bacterium]
MRFRTHLVTAALCTALLLASAGSWAQIRISVNIAPPPLPVYAQPELPGPGYLWVPGYWAWADGGYYWVPGTWVQPPEPGLLWTPGFWGWTNGAYVWNEGYWAPQVGFYGGVDYGFGYDGIGFAGGYWSRGAFFYNRAVNHLPARGRFHVYSRPVPRRTHSRASFNGGRGGIAAHATPAQLALRRGRHVAPIAAQRQQEQAADRNPEFRASTHHGRPPIGATARPGQFAP